MQLLTWLGVILIGVGVRWVALRVGMERRTLPIVGRPRDYSVLRVDLGDGHVQEVGVPGAVHDHARTGGEIVVWVRERGDDDPVVLYGSLARRLRAPAVTALFGVILVWRGVVPAAFEDSGAGVAWDLTMGIGRSLGFFVLGALAIGLVVAMVGALLVAAGRRIFGTTEIVDIARTTWRKIDGERVDVSIAYLALQDQEPIEILLEDRLPVGTRVAVTYVPRWPEATWKVTGITEPTSD
jgi:hypothetical protein